MFSSSLSECRENIDKYKNFQVVSLGELSGAPVFLSVTLAVKNILPGIVILLWLLLAKCSNFNFFAGVKAD